MKKKIALKRISEPVIKQAYTTHEDLAIMLSHVTKLSLNKPICVGDITHEDLAIMVSHVKKLSLNKPIYVGVTVLEISKLWMYSFHRPLVR